ncbi:MAG: CobW family GTP-binding protein [Gammaproteobacteria bacterium]
MNKIPTAIIAGFLGAGKTTLVNQILNHSRDSRIAVLVNDFGDINIDAQLITRVEGETISLSNGCICCSIRGDLVAALLRLLERDPLPDYIVIEASGISDPSAAAMGLVMSTRLAAALQLDAIVTLVDAEQAPEADSDYADLATDQLAAADIVIINKTDCATRAQIDDVTEWARRVSPQARIVEASFCRVPLELVFGTGAPGVMPRVDAISGHNHALHPEHAERFSAWSWTHAEPLSFEATYAFFKALPLSIFRAKGIVYLDDVRDRRVILQMVGKRVLLSRGAPWDAAQPGSQIVMIGTSGGIDADLMDRRLEACLARNSPSSGNRMAQAVVEILRRP